MKKKVIVRNSLELDLDFWGGEETFSEFSWEEVKNVILNNPDKFKDKMKWQFWVETYNGEFDIRETKVYTID